MSYGVRKVKNVGILVQKQKIKEKWRIVKIVILGCMGYVKCRKKKKVCSLGMTRAGNRAGRAGLDRANSGSGQNQAGSKLVRFFRAKILTAQSVLKTGPVWSNSFLKAKKKFGWDGSGRAIPGRAIPGRAKFGPIFFGPII